MAIEMKALIHNRVCNKLLQSERVEIEVVDFEEEVGEKLGRSLA